MPQGKRVTTPNKKRISRHLAKNQELRYRGGWGKGGPLNSERQRTENEGLACEKWGETGRKTCLPTRKDCTTGRKAHEIRVRGVKGEGREAPKGGEIWGKNSYDGCGRSRTAIPAEKKAKGGGGKDRKEGCGTFRRKGGVVFGRWGKESIVSDLKEAQVGRGRRGAALGSSLNHLKGGPGLGERNRVDVGEGRGFLGARRKS